MRPGMIGLLALLVSLGLALPLAGLCLLAGGLLRRGRRAWYRLAESTPLVSGRWTIDDGP